MKTALLVLVLIGVWPAHAREQQLTLSLWSELEPMVAEGEEYPVSEETAARRLLEEARLYLSAMIFGYRFTYIPKDRARALDDHFDLTPVAEIPWGDPSLRIVYVERREDRLVAKVSYDLQAYQTDRRRAWGSNAIPVAGGLAEQSALGGQAARLAAFQEAVKQAVRDYARTRYPSKPREIAGDVLLWEEPCTVISRGAYNTRVTVKLRVEEITPYRVF